MNIKCESCKNSRLIVSENGWKRVCNLSQVEEMLCITGRVKYYLPKRFTAIISRDDAFDWDEAPPCEESES